MEISLAGIEQAVEGLCYRSDKSPKSRLINTLRKRYSDSGAVESVSAVDTDTLIDNMWGLNGDAKAIRSKRKNLNSIKSSVNTDLNEAWKVGRNPEGITIGPLNTFIMSDAAKDKILSSFSGAVNLEGGNSLDRVTEALKIVSEYLSNLPGGLEDDKLSNLKSLVEGLTEKFKDSSGPGEFEITEKKTDSGGMDDDTIESEVDDSQVIMEEDVIEEDAEAFEFDDSEIIEVMDEEEIIEDTDDEEELIEDEIVEDIEEVEQPEDETEIEEIAEEDMDDYEEAVEDDSESLESDDVEVVEVLDEADAIDEPDDGEPVDEEEILEDADDGVEQLEDEAEIEEIAEEDLDDIEIEKDEIDEVAPEVPDEIELVDEGDVVEDELDDPETLETDDAEIIDVMDGDETLDESEEIEITDDEDILEDMDVLAEDTEIEEIDESETDEIDEVLDEDTTDFEEGDDVEKTDEEDVTELEEADIFEDEDVLEEVDEAEIADSDDDTETDEDVRKDDLGLPLDQLAEDILNDEEFQPDEEQKRLLAERFDGYLGAMERYYNQYIIIKRGKYIIGADDIEEDVLKVQKISLPDYYMGKYPVTNALFEVFIERTGYKTTAEKLGFGYVYQGRFQKTVDPKTGLSRSTWNPAYTRRKVEGAAWYQPTGPGSTLHQKRNHPVAQVSIKDARTFAAWTGKRLPTEIEWEAAARTRSGFIFPWGNEWKEGSCNLEDCGLSDTCPVDAHPSGTNEAGLADLVGNVLEWTADECEPKYPLEKPMRFFIAKGGAWVNNERTPLYMRTRFEAEFTANIVGFRCLAD